MEYDLSRVLDHPLMLEGYLPSAIAVFGGLAAREYRIQIRYRRNASCQEQSEPLVIRWDLDRLEQRVPNLRVKVANLIARDHYRKLQTENAAVIVAVAVLENLEPGTRFSMRSDSGTFHDYFLNDRLDEAIEVAGRGTSKTGLDMLFLEEKAQSDRNPTLRKRWVSVTVFSRRPRSRTEGLHHDDT